MESLENMNNQQDLPASSDQIAQNQARTGGPGDTNGAQAVPGTFWNTSEWRVVIPQGVRGTVVEATMSGVTLRTDDGTIVHYPWTRGSPSPFPPHEEMTE